jgi:dihydroorotate dehydrogenase
MTLDLGATVAGVRLPFCAMNASHAVHTAANLRALADSHAGAIVLGSSTVHPFLHPAFRTLHNPGHDKLLPLARELAMGGKPVVASVVGGSAEEYGFLARAFGEAGVALVEANLADAWVEVTLAPFDDVAVLRTILAQLTTASVPVSVKLPERMRLSYRELGEELRAAGVRAAVARNDFLGYEKLLLEGGPGFDVIAAGAITSGYDVRRALAKGAKAVQVDTSLGKEGPGIFARLAKEMRAARGG